MQEGISWGFWSLLPLLVALLIAFKTRSAVFSLLAGSTVGVVMLGAWIGYNMLLFGQAGL